MKISDFKFCHIPKTAGMSICEIIGPGNFCHHCVCDKNKINKFLFTFVRHPYTRFLSAFFYLKNGGINNLDQKDNQTYIGQLSVKEFIIEKLYYASHNQQHFRPQNYWIPNGADFIGQYENLQSDFSHLKKIIDIPENAQLPHINKTDYNYILSSLEKKILYYTYIEDFRSFQYNS